MSEIVTRVLVAVFGIGATAVIAGEIGSEVETHFETVRDALAAASEATRP